MLSINHVKLSIAYYITMVRTVLHSNSSVITHLHEIGSGFYGSEVET